MTNTIIPTGKWTIDPTHSEISFTVKHLMISKVKGVFKEFEGSGSLNDENFAGSDFTAAVKTASISTNEENRDAHLRSGDFFDTDIFPTATFSASNVQRGKNSDEYVLHGDLTIKDVTKAVSFNVTVGGVAVDPYGQTKAAVEATTTINRTDFGLTWNSALEAGGVLVSEKVTISAELQLILSN